MTLSMLVEMHMQSMLNWEFTFSLSVVFVQLLCILLFDLNKLIDLSLAMVALHSSAYLIMLHLQFPQNWSDSVP